MIENIITFKVKLSTNKIIHQNHFHYEKRLFFYGGTVCRNGNSLLSNENSIY